MTASDFDMRRITLLPARSQDTRWSAWPTFPLLEMDFAGLPVAGHDGAAMVFGGGVWGVVVRRDIGDLPRPPRLETVSRALFANSRARGLRGFSPAPAPSRSVLRNRQRLAHHGRMRAMINWSPALVSGITKPRSWQGPVAANGPRAPENAKLAAETIGD